MDNLLSKLTRLHIEERSFTPEGSRDPIKFSIAVLTIQIHGQSRAIELKISKDKSMVLELADTIDRTL
jgi:hypothetical protein